MLLCPTCDATLSQDFGMVTCQKCHSVLMIDMSGKVQVGSETLSQEDSELENSINEGFETSNEQTVDESDFFNPSQVTAPNTNDGFYPAGEELVSQFQDDIVESESGVFEESKVDIKIHDEYEGLQSNFEASDYDQDDFGVNDQKDDKANNEVEETFGEIEDFNPIGVSDKPDSSPVDVTSFANSQESNLNDGEYLYDLTISRIDSKELREELKSVLKDEKLKLNFHEYMKKIKAGKVIIPNLNPIKTKRIVEQLQYLDFQIHWTQKRVVMQQNQEKQGQDDDEAIEDISI